ncbi:MAG: hypothetical protein WC666_04710 [Candidatus Paceibacterota bacterium]|jgi:hypothetical protein
MVLNRRSSCKFVITVFSLLSVCLIPSITNAQRVIINKLEDNSVGIELNKDLSNVTIRPLEEGYTSDYLKRYPTTIESQTKYAQCLSGYVSAARFEGEIADLETSIAEVDLRITSLNKTINYLKLKKDINGLKLYGVPAGEVENRKYEWAREIAMKCLIAKGSNVKSIKAVGSLTNDIISVFNSIPKKQTDLLAKLRKENETTDIALKKEIKESGSLSKWTIINLGLKMKNISSDMAKNVISIVPDDVGNYPILKDSGDDSLFAINYILDANGKKQESEIPKFARALMEGDDKVAVKVNLTLGNVTYSEVELPEGIILTSMRNAAFEHVKRLRTVRSDLQKNLDKLNKSLKDLKDNNYVCN